MKQKPCISTRLEYIDINFSFIPQRNVNLNDIGTQKDEEQSDPIRVPFFPLEVRNPKKYHIFCS